ncbi:hypothetical protein GUITHDRAFT_103532 [Guillardia theta CCMP2712]|uniref:Major facilitator superfamily (MFS) profile domain-containing protein n=1 Tax=Guillardia theta (strain CCMP2712) TaxID=905079 RepID=L1JQW2_GUITC|nr:hypothetical protein GUITHDRAFT_103532 [Guillardia theta CCMP2712]EKX50951.1 hypothetical protein GUITHDRAFT_103532 [Guillardia theta CCMP2712]|eukprot:XP_005837931.1 hypothetical protein GUITHDRAFT_103532 [Guillardia theta CCMP2712]
MVVNQEQKREKTHDNQQQRAAPLGIRIFESLFPGRWYGHAVLASCIPIFLSANPGQSFFLGLYTEYLVQDFGVSRETVSALFFFSLAGSSVYLQLIGRVVDRIGTRATVKLGLLPFCMSLLVMSQSRNFYLTCLSYVGMRMLGPETVAFSAMVTVNRWFRKLRGRAAAGLQIALALQLQLAAVVNVLMQQYGWREVTMLCTLVVLLLDLPALLFLQNSPEEVGLLPDGLKHEGDSLEEAEGGKEEEREINFTFWEAIRTYQCWFIIAVAFTLGSGWGGMNVHLQAFCAERGMLPSSTSLIYSAVGLFVPAGAVITGGLLDGVSNNNDKLRRCSVIIAIFMSNSAMAFSFGVFTGLFVGGNQVMGITIFASLYGRAHVGSMQALLAAAGLLGVAIGPVFFAITHSVWKSFNPILIATASTQLFLCAMFFFIAAPRKEGGGCDEGNPGDNAHPLAEKDELDGV